MIINIDQNAGFCWGVVRAVNYAENELKDVRKIYSLGDIIHNADEVKRLKNLGLTTISVDDLKNLEKNSKVFIRAHGEPPSTYKTALEYGLDIIDATCPVVIKVQERIRKFYNQNYQIVIFGKKDHAEVIGLNGVTENNAIIISNLNDALKKIDFKKPTVLFSQTTMDKETFSNIANALKEKVSDLIIETMENNAVEFLAKDTICGQVSGREKKLREFSKTNDVIIFTAGRKSSNGKVLFDIVREENSNSFFIESSEEIDWSWFANAESVGITGATSTPKWIMEDIKNLIEEKFNLIEVY